MTTDAATQLAILADALTEIVDLATGAEKKGNWRRPAKCWRSPGARARRGMTQRIPICRHCRDGALTVC